MSTADAVKKFGFSRASGFEDFRNRLMEQLVVIMEFRASVFPHGVTDIPELTEG
jgi:hypothetical protein